MGRGRHGRDTWLREGRRQLEQHRWENPDPIAAHGRTGCLCQRSGWTWSSICSARSNRVRVVQGINAQTAANEQQIVPAAEITNLSTDFSPLDPLATATVDELERAGIDQLPEAVAADTGYWNEEQMDEVVANKHVAVLVATDKGTRGTPSAG